jgi:hypothetical protein
VVAITVSTLRRVPAGVEQVSMEETAECPDGAEVSRSCGIDGPGRSAVLENDRSSETPDGRWCGGGDDDDDRRAAYFLQISEGGYPDWVFY